MVHTVSSLSDSNQPSDSSTPTLWSVTHNLLSDGEFLSYKIQGQLKVISAEADLWLLKNPTSAQPLLLKFYRIGITPALITQPLTHPNIISTIASGQYEGRYYEIFPYYPAGGLHNFLKSTPPTWDQFRNVASEPPTLKFTLLSRHLI